MISSGSYLAGVVAYFIANTPSIIGRDIFARFIDYRVTGVPFATRIDCQLFNIDVTDNPPIEDCKLEL